jgi:hypothetical protein
MRRERVERLSLAGKEVPVLDWLEENHPETKELFRLHFSEPEE